MKAVNFLESLMLRLFCGKECWLIEYDLTFPCGKTISGFHKTYLPLSERKTPEERRSAGFEILKEIGSAVRMETGLIPNGGSIKSHKRVW